MYVATAGCKLRTQNITYSYHSSKTGAEVRSATPEYDDVQEFEHTFALEACLLYGQIAARTEERPGVR